MNDKVYLPPIPGQDLPSLPTDDVEENVEIVEEVVISSDDLDDEPDFKTEAEPDAKPIIKVKRTKDSKPILMMGIFVCLVSIGFVASAFINKKSTVTLSGVSKTSRLSLMSYINGPVENGLKIKIKKINGKSSFWLVSNYRLDAKVLVTLSSKKNRTLGLEKVNIEGEGSFHSGAAYLSNIKMKDGLSITPGEYHYSVAFYPRGMSFRINNILKNYFNINFYKAELSQTDFNGDVIFYKKGEREFEKKIKQFHLTIDKKIRDPLKEQLSRYKTFDGLLERAFSHYVSKIDSMKNGSDVSVFEILYNKDVGPFLRDLMIDANRIHIANLNIDPQKSKVYDEIFNIGRQIGEMASDMVTDTIKYTKLKKKNRAVLKKKFAKIFSEIKLEITSQTSHIKLELDKYEN